MGFHLGNLAELSTRLSSPDKALTGEPCQGSAGLTFSTGPGRGRLGALSLGGVNTSQSTYLKIWGLKKKTSKQTLLSFRLLFFFRQEKIKEWKV